tara:strand:+ start:741 stop:1004 length:264 start_codon:yes stop_codon:yes gene_type:complete
MEPIDIIEENKTYVESLADFSFWLDRNIHLILNVKQTKLFNKLKMNFDDIKLFGKSTSIEKYYQTHNIKELYEQEQFNWVLNYSVAN